jgi:hypothetical protein
MSIKKVLRNIPGLQALYWYLLMKYNKYLFNKDPKILANKSYRRTFKSDINWEEPNDLNEKTIWMQFNTDTSLWSRLADKNAVREYVKEKGEERLLNKLYGSYASADDINFDILPNQFVLKTNNASGTVIIVKNKEDLNIPKTRKKLNRWLGKSFIYNNAELHYRNIEPCITAEEFLEDKTQPQLIDYKFYCFYGVPESIFVVSHRSSRIHNFKANIYDTDWNRISEHLLYPIDENISKPKSYEIMVEACMNLSKDIPFVRIDFYEIDGKPFFGEMTFTPGYIFTKEYYTYLGSKLDLNKVV